MRAKAPSFARTVVLVVLTMAASLLSVLPGSTVLCFGSDGHVRVEDRASGPCHQQTVSAPDSARRSDRLAQAACDPSCFDLSVPLVSDTASRSERTESSRMAAPAVGHASVLPSAGLGAAAGAAVAPMFPSPGGDREGLDRLLSIVLLL